MFGKSYMAMMIYMFTGVARNEITFCTALQYHITSLLLQITVIIFKRIYRTKHGLGKAVPSLASSIPLKPVYRVQL